jgi:hypothetical protein
MRRAPAYHRRVSQPNLRDLPEASEPLETIAAAREAWDRGEAGGLLQSAEIPRARPPGSMRVVQARGLGPPAVDPAGARFALLHPPRKARVVRSRDGIKHADARLPGSLGPSGRLAVHPDGERLAWLQPGRITISDLRAKEVAARDVPRPPGVDGAPLAEHDPLRAAPENIAFSADGAILWQAGHDQEGSPILTAYDAALREAGRLSTRDVEGWPGDGATWGWPTLVVDPAGHDAITIAVSFGDSAGPILRAELGGAELRARALPLEAREPWNGVRWLPDGERLLVAFGMFDDRLAVVDTRGRVLVAPYDPLASLRADPDVLEVDELTIGEIGVTDAEVILPLVEATGAGLRAFVVLDAQTLVPRGLRAAPRNNLGEARWFHVGSGAYLCDAGRPGGLLYLPC